MSKLPFVPRIFFSVLVVVLVLLVAALAVVKWIYGSVSTTDKVGSSISSLIFAYLVHLWLLPPERSPEDDEQSGKPTKAGTD